MQAVQGGESFDHLSRLEDQEDREVVVLVMRALSLSRTMGARVRCR